MNRYLRVLGLGADEKLKEDLKQKQLARLSQGEVDPAYKPVKENYEDVSGIPYERTFPPRP